MKEISLLDYTVNDLFKYNSNEYAQSEAVIFYSRHITYTWKELDNLTDEIAKSLIANDIKRSDHVAIWGTNIPEWMLVQYAVQKIGAILITINPEWKADDVRYVLEQSDTKMLIMMKGFLKHSSIKLYPYDYIKIIKQVIPEIEKFGEGNIDSKNFPKLKKIVLISKNSEKGFLNWDKFVKSSDSISDSDLKLSTAQVKSGDIAFIQYTSGTTGFPKGAMLTQHNVINNSFIIYKYKIKIEHCVDKICGPVPFYHCFGSILVNILGLCSGCTIVIPSDTFDPIKVLEAIDVLNCTTLYGVPTMFIALLEKYSTEQYKTDTLRTGIIAGASCSKELMEDIIYKLGAKEITIGYGLTEASPLTHQTDIDDSLDKRILTVGKPLPLCSSKIINPDNLHEVGYGEHGEIWTKGYHVMKGYYNKPEETSAAFCDGWLRSGDIGYCDKNGYYIISGRLKEMFIVGGHNVYPAEVENSLNEIFKNEIEQVYAVGIPDTKYQEVCGIAIKFKNGCDVENEIILQKCRDKMEWQKIPRYIKKFDDFSSFMTATGKIQKFKLSEAIHND
ncbi:MAG TPA: AMP-binding protein [Victivallales bacterium]|nr:AMP-binding protein [Victivallales bacterium]